MSVRISAAICTLNRACYLGNAVRSLVDQSLPPDSYEILVVDNGSTDTTQDLVLREYSHVQNLRYLYEPILGLSRARNTGWINALGEYVAYMDDDAIASPQWLERILDAFDTVSPSPGCVGGKVEPIWEAPRPSWLSDARLSHLSLLDWSTTPITLSRSQWLVGTNIAFPRALLESIGGFHVALGRKGGRLLSMEEALVRQRLEENGFQAYYHPEIAVQHHVPASRLTKRWFAKRVYYQGVSNALVRIHHESPSRAMRLKMAISAASGLLRRPHQLAGLLIPTDNPDRFSTHCSIYGRLGYISGLLGVARQ